jgi:hypothetical protein
VHKSYVYLIDNEIYYNGLLKRKDGKRKLKQAMRDERNAINKAIIKSETGKKI